MVLNWFYFRARIVHLDIQWLANTVQNCLSYRNGYICTDNQIFWTAKWFIHVYSVLLFTFSSLFISGHWYRGFKNGFFFFFYCLNPLESFYGNAGDVSEQKIRQILSDYKKVFSTFEINFFFLHCWINPNVICINKLCFFFLLWFTRVKENVIGWYRQRRNTRQQMTFMEQVIHQNMRKILSSQELVFMLLTPSQATTSGSTHRLEFSAFLWHSRWDPLNSGTHRHKPDLWSLEN